MPRLWSRSTLRGFLNLAKMVTVVKVETLADKLANVEVKALVDTLA